MEEPYDEEYFLEAALFPWLDDGSMEMEPEPDYGDRFDDNCDGYDDNDEEEDS